MGGRGSGGAGAARGGGGGRGALDRSQMTDAQKRAEIKAIDGMEFSSINVNTHRTGFDQYTGESFNYNESIVSTAHTKNSEIVITKDNSTRIMPYGALLYSGGKLVGATSGSSLSETKSRAKSALKNYYKGYNL